MTVYGVRRGHGDSDAIMLGVFRRWAPSPSSLSRCRASLTTVASAIVERLPLTVPDLEPWEKDWDDVQADLDERFSKPMPKFVEKALDERMSQPDMVRFSQNFEPAPRVTQDDINDVRTSLDRKLDCELVLIVKDTKTGKWQFPSAVWTGDPETIRQTADRAISTTIGEELDFQFTGQAPIAHVSYTEGGEETRVFFLRAFYVSGQVQSQEFLWVTKNEIGEYVDERLNPTIQKLLLVAGN
ncbi:unnamed protein product (mitochondrion) [Plasmodiophora brassicae]|uniref:Ribosomal protein L46 N-terminal domain-containing protein n=1 Tax=Plasmodiophora brassicae TaxID=37360 RepID=A0A3P3YN84_PLABS|nr:unnamed protein product [Plasmodiophora brassicae]